MRQQTNRDKAILCGLYLAQWDRAGLARLGFTTFKEAYNVLGYALGVQPASIKNYRDELDPLFSNPRKGWHNRPVRPNTARIHEAYRGYELEELASMIAKLTGVNFGDSPSLEEQSSFAKRLLTGVAAENYFLHNYQRYDAFKAAEVRDMTMAGCGYDFSLLPESGEISLAVEVKGLGPKEGGIMMTAKEYEVATSMTDRYYLYVVVDMDILPKAMVFRNPLVSGLSFKRMERSITQTSWQTRV